MLGIKRIRERRDGMDKITISMAVFVDGMVKSFEDHLPKTNPGIPFPATPAKKWLYKTDATAEERKEVLELGYQFIVGMLLWEARGTYPECAIQGYTNWHGSCVTPSGMPGSVRCIIMVNWMRVNRSCGIVFSDKGNPHPIVFSDASNKPDDSDGKS